MASAITHAVVGVALVAACPPAEVSTRHYVVAAVCAMLPDADAIGFSAGVPYASLLGHRGLTHSLAVAAVIAALAVALAFRDVAFGSRAWWRLAALFFVATASHGVLDALTNGGLGVAFFSPFSNTRWFLPWRPIEVSPLQVSAFFSAAGLSILVNEAEWVWLPAAVLVAVSRVSRGPR